MVFSSTVFLLLFLPAVICFYYNPLAKSIRYKNAVLLIASLCFYAWGEPVFVFLMIFSIFVTWFMGILIDKTGNNKPILIIAIIYHVGVLFVFKYLTFAAQQIGLLVFHKDIDLEIVLPIGISFFTFQMMSYLFDVYYKKATVQKNILKLSLYVSLFPQLIAGPIVRYKSIEKEISHRVIKSSDFTDGMERFIYGLAKKVLLSNYLAYIADSVFDAPDRTVAIAWLGAISYTLQIYFDFSGYSDMAIGLGRILGFHFEENFNYPYVSKSVTEFWRRWHISLSSWFRDYVYIPLGGNRVSRNRWIFNIFIVWLLTGIWHGANWTFICWGMLYYIILMIEKLTSKQGNKNEKISIGKKTIGRIYTLLIVTLAWVIFRSESIGDAIGYLGNMFGVGVSGMADRSFLDLLLTGMIVLIIACILSAPIYLKLINKIGTYNRTAELITRSVIIILLFVLSLVEVISSTYNPFIYFNF